MVEILENLKNLAITRVMTPEDEEMSHEKELEVVSAKLRKTKAEEQRWEKQLNLVK